MAEARKIDDYIAKAFIDLGFTTNDIKNGCRLLERENKKTGEMIKVAWIVYHKFLERAAQKAGITFDEPKVFNLEKDEIALYVNGHKGDFSAWAIGEASAGNLTSTSKNYRWAMAEKREKTDFEKEAAAEKTARTKALKAGKDIPQPKGSLEERYAKAIAYLEQHSAPYTNSAIDSLNNLVSDLYASDKVEEGTTLNALINDRQGLNDIIVPEFD